MCSYKLHLRHDGLDFLGLVTIVDGSAAKVNGSFAHREYVADSQPQRHIGFGGSDMICINDHTL